MLERLADVAWDTLSCAGGAASDLPRYLRAIASPERAEALAALHEMRTRVFHEGEVFEATPHVIPFLVELALRPEVLVRPPILQLFAFLHSSQGNDGFVAAARRAVRHHLHDYLSLLADPDRDVRIAAACLCTGFRDPDAEPDVRLALTRRFPVEPDEVVRANLIGCLNVYLPTSRLEVYDEALAQDASLLVRREAAHSIAAVAHEDAPTLVAATLLEGILHAAELEPLYAGVAWNRRGVVADSLWALTRMGAAARAYLRYLEKLMSRAAPRDALAIAEAALLIAFGGPAGSRSLVDLAPEEVSLLRAIAETDAIWGQELPRMLAHYGVPREQEALRAFVSRS